MTKKLYLLVSAPDSDGLCKTHYFHSYNARARYILDELMGVDWWSSDDDMRERYADWEPEFGNWNDERDPDMRWYLSEVELDLQPVSKKQPKPADLKTYTVVVRQFVEEVAEIEVQALSPKDAVDEVNERELKGELDPSWSEGDDIRDFEVYFVKDDGGDVVWEA